MALIQCPQCGNMISDRAAQCPRCGLGFQPNQPAPQPPQRRHQSGSSNAIIITVVIILVLCAVGAGAFYVLTSNGIGDLSMAAEAVETVEAVEAAPEEPVVENVSLDNYVKVTGTHVRLRHLPSLNSQIYMGANGYPVYPYKGELLKCVGESGDFYMVEYDNRTLYISKQYCVPVY